VNDPVAALEDRIATLEREIDNLRLVQECTATLISSLDFDETLNIILRTARNAVGTERGSILLHNIEQTHLTIAYAVGLSEETINYTRIPIGEGFTGQVAQSGNPILVEDIDEDPRFEERRSRSDRSRSFACLPLIYHGRTLGVMNLSHPTGDRPFNENSLPLLGALANQAAVAIAHSELHRSLLEKERLEQQVETARSIQESFISPRIRVQHGDYIFMGCNVAAKAVGGDFYDVMELDNGKAALFLGDVSGKGIPAALYMARLFSDVHHRIAMDSNPEAVLRSLNHSLHKRQHRGMFVTMACGLIIPEKNIARVCIAGHPPPIVRKKDGSVSSLPPAQFPPLGLLEEVPFNSYEVGLCPGDLILMYTDGVNEATNSSGEEFGTKRIEQLLRDCGKEEAPVERLYEGLLEFTHGHPIRDDITLLTAARI
jgi:sigma-B regulation protein RsbU (phosphoserine phosphatase)